jgi:hypothetical protein
MLTPISETPVPLLLSFYQLCWRWPYTLLDWRVTQVTPIYKKDPTADPGNYRLISLTSIFQKMLKYCLIPTLIEHSPDIDLAQGGFRQSRESLDQTLCLAEIYQLLRLNYSLEPVLAFLDIKFAYGTVNRIYCSGYNYFI